MIRRALMILALLALSCPVQAQETRKATFIALWDLDSDTVLYPVLLGTDGNPFGDPMQVATLIETSGSSTTVTAVTALTVPFADLGVGDLIFVRTSATNTDIRSIVAKASGDSITINAAADWSAGAGFQFTWMDAVIGATVNDGWISTAGWNRIKVKVNYAQGDFATGLDVRWECRDRDLAAYEEIAYPDVAATCGDDGVVASGYCQFATAGAGTGLTLIIPGPWDECRVGMKRTGNDTSDAGAALESIAATISESKEGIR